MYYYIYKQWILRLATIIKLEDPNFREDKIEGCGKPGTRPALGLIIPPVTGSIWSHHKKLHTWLASCRDLMVILR